jgi:hypothetical protein
MAVTSFGRRRAGIAVAAGRPSWHGSPPETYFSSEDNGVDGITSAGRNRQRRARAGSLAMALAGVAVLAAACAGGSPTGSGPGNGQTPYQQALAYARCMRAHGDPSFPDPNSQGLFRHPARPRYQSASNACGHLLPSRPLTTAQKQQHVSQALKFSACMRAQGVPGFPDPIIVQGGTAVGLRPPRNVDQNSPRFQSAVRACRELEPGMAGQLTGSGAP